MPRRLRFCRKTSFNQIADRLRARSHAFAKTIVIDPLDQLRIHRGDNPREFFFSHNNALEIMARMSSMLLTYCYAIGITGISARVAGFFMTSTSARMPIGTPVKAFLDEDLKLTN